MRRAQREHMAGTEMPRMGAGRGRVLLLVILAVLVACGPDEASRSPGSSDSDDGAGAAQAGDREAVRARPEPAKMEGDAARPGASDRSVVATEEDWRIVLRKVQWGRSHGLDTLPVGEAVARLGATFVGTPYVPRTLEVEGPERLVVNLRALDCVTFVETVLALVHLIREAPPGVDLPSDGAGPRTEPGEELKQAYRRALTRIRYRDGVLDGYPSRLHYFSEWIRDAEEKGLVRNVTADLGGEQDSEPIDFMTEHPDAYRQLADSGVRAEIRRIEKRISRTPRTYLPQKEIPANTSGIHDGDIIAATSTAAGLDVAHTGLALWRDGRLHLLHAPLVGDSVQISERPLARRILETDGQDGILVARPTEPGSAPARRE